MQLMDQLLLPAPRRVTKVDLDYDKAAKQVRACHEGVIPIV
jgi:hypothetical protein